MLLSEVFKRDIPKHFVSKHAVNTDSIQPERLIGIEIELEELNPDAPLRAPGFSFITDNSLRNSEDGIAREAVSSPIRLCDADGLLYAFWQAVKVTDNNFSERCSIHVHVNTLDMTVEQLGSLCLVYQTLERLLFEFIGGYGDTQRKDNIFCVPWHQSGLTYNYVNDLVKDPTYKARAWQKYTALNLLPLAEQGTVEFRHLYGTADLKKIGQWLQIIGCLFEYATKNRFDDITKQIMEMNTISNYREWLTAVFCKHADLFCSSPNYESALNRGVIDTKFMISGPVETKAKLRPDPLTTADMERLMQQYRAGVFNAAHRDATVAAAALDDFWRTDPPAIDPVPAGGVRLLGGTTGRQAPIRRTTTGTGRIATANFQNQWEARLEQAIDDDIERTPF